MNARQKAKRFKRLYEGLLKQPQPIVFAGPNHIDTLRFEKCYPDELLRNSPNATSYILMEIAQSLAAGLGKYIVYRTYYDPTTDTCRISGEIKVVNR